MLILANDVLVYSEILHNFLIQSIANKFGDDEVIFTTITHFVTEQRY